MKVVVTGGAGAMAHAAVVYLLEQKDVEEVVLYDLNETRLSARVASFHGERRVKSSCLDVNDLQATIEGFRGADVVLNCGAQPNNVPVLKAALEAGANYVGLNSSFEPHRQLALSDQFREKGIVGIIGLGTATGMSNIMATYGVDQLDTVESIEILDACVNIVPHSNHNRALHWGFYLPGIINEFTMDANYFSEGEMKVVPAGSFPEWVNFRPPVGRLLVAVTTHLEPTILSQTFKHKGIKHVSWKIGFEEEFERKMRFLRDLGFLSEKPVVVGSQKVVPRQFLIQMLENQPLETKTQPDFRGHMMVIVKGKKNNEKVEYTITEYAPEELTLKMQKRGVLGSYRTGIYTAIGVLLAGRGKIEKRGVFHPDNCVPADVYLREVAVAGIQVDISKRIFL